MAVGQKPKLHKAYLADDAQTFQFHDYSYFIPPGRLAQLILMNQYFYELIYKIKL